MRILLTGGAGFIGHHLARAYLEKGWEVVVLDDLSTGRADRLQSDIRLIAGGLDAAAALLKNEEGFDLVSHHAAQASVAFSVRDPVADARTNLMGGIALLESVAGRVGQVLFASTGGAIYGEVPGRPAREDDPLLPLSPYGAAKAAFEVLLASWGRRHGVPVTALRYSNVYGPGQDPKGEAGVVAIFGRRLALGEQTEIHGDGGQERDFIHVDDVVAANLAALGHPGVFNIGTGTPSKVAAVWRGLAPTGTADARRTPPRPGDLRRSVLDPGRAGEVLGWSAKVTLETGLARMREYDWGAEA
ncbi:NAD-dependent epimerase/dehydratase family protein [bacterium]|nr:NAD-dependent epimerase/dehydratase family protein [bacterium]